MRSFRTWGAVSLFAVALSLGVGSRASADEELPPPAPGPVYLAVSLLPEFALDRDDDGIPVAGSPTVFANIGSFVTGGDLDAIEFTATDLSLDLLENGIDISILFGNEATVFGSVHTTGEDGEPHMLTPDPAAVPPEVQAALYDASIAPPGAGGLADLLENPENPLPTTYDIAYVIATFVQPPLEEGEDIGPRVDLVFQGVFAGDQVLRQVGDTLSVTSEGEMFPHDPGAPALIFSFTFDEEGELDSDLCQPIAIDVMPGSDRNPINVAKKKGDLPIALLTDGDFDAADADGGTVVLGGIKATRTALEDVDGDGDLDLICHWDLPTLREAGLDEDVDELFVFAELVGGGCVAGHDGADTFAKP